MDCDEQDWGLCFAERDVGEEVADCRVRGNLTMCPRLVIAHCLTSEVAQEALKRVHEDTGRDSSNEVVQVVRSLGGHEGQDLLNTHDGLSNSGETKRSAGGLAEKRSAP